jgi:hypothetical protein
MIRVPRKESQTIHLTQQLSGSALRQDASNLSPAVISPLTAEWQADYDAWQTRDLSARRYVSVLGGRGAGANGRTRRIHAGADRRAIIGILKHLPQIDL